MTPDLSDELLARLSGFATDAFGLRFPPDRWHELARGIASAALELGIADLGGWAESLVSGVRHSEHLAAVANHLTIPETYFLRQRDSFTLLEKEILPARIAERRKQQRTLRIWSAGCASGEEPYSVAILLRHGLPEFRPQSVSIVGTDINAHVLARAQRAVYSDWSFRDTPEWLKTGFFHPLHAGKYELVAEIRQMVRFVPLNLAAPLYPAEFGERGDFDVILCRNVLMYFSAEWQDRIIRRLAGALAPEGWFLVGPCDVTAEQALDLRLHSSHPGVFQKLSSDVAFQTRQSAGFAPAGSIEVTHQVGQGFEIVGQPEHATGEAARESIQRPPEQTRTVAGVGVANPLPAPPLEAIARTHADRGELEDALAACDQAIAENNMDSDLHHLRACVLMEMNRSTEAEEGFRRVLYLDPDSVMAHFALGSLAQRAGRRDEARHHFGLILRILSSHGRGEPVPRGDGITVGRLKEVVKRTLEDSVA